MSISFAAALAGTVLAAVGTGLAIRLCLRKPRADMVAWVIALAGLTVGLAAQAAGYRRGFAPTTFRATQLGAALVAPVALSWGMAELAAKSLVARFAARLCLAGLFVVAAVILATDVLSARGFTQQWPAPRDYFQYVSLSLLALVAAAVVLTVIAALITSGLRSRHNPAWRGPLAAIALAAVAALATQGLLVKLPANVAYPGLTLVAAVATWLAATRAAGVNVGQLRAGAAAPAVRGRPGTRATTATTRWICTAMATATSTTARPLPRTSTAGTTPGATAPRASPAAPPGTGARKDAAPPGTAAGEKTAPPGTRTRADSRPGGYPGPGGFPPEDTGGFHADPVEPVTGAFDPLFRPSASSAQGQAAGRPGSDAATLNRACRG